MADVRSLLNIWHRNGPIERRSSLSPNRIASTKAVFYITAFGGEPYGFRRFRSLSRTPAAGFPPGDPDCLALVRRAGMVVNAFRLLRTSPSQSLAATMRLLFAGGNTTREVAWRTASPQFYWQRRKEFDIFLSKHHVNVRNRADKGSYPTCYTVSKSRISTRFMIDRSSI